MWELLFLLLPLAAFSGWIVGKKALSGYAAKLSRLDYLLQRQPNNAVDVIAKLLDTNQETVDTHLALGGLFRRQGEVDKAVSIHQNLIAKSSLTDEQRALSLLELSRDYMRAGVLDRAEGVLQDLIKQGHYLEASFQHLIEIYQQSKDWPRAIEAALKLQEKTDRDMRHHIAHFYCELAEQHWLKGERTDTVQFLKDAHHVNRHCVRASLLLGNMEAQSGRYKAAIKAYKQVQRQDSAFLSEVIAPLSRCYEGLNDSDGMVKYFNDCLQSHPSISVVLVFTEWLYKMKGEAAASEFVVGYLREHPSLRGLSRLIQFRVAKAEGAYQQDLQLLQELIEKMVSNKPLYRCQACGFAGRTLQWQCPSCKRWDVIKPIHD